jgi:hypothetical protein
MELTMALTPNPGRMAMAMMIFRGYGTEFDQRNLQKEPHSDDDDGSVARDSLEGNESGNDQDYMEPDDEE